MKFSSIVVFVVVIFLVLACRPSSQNGASKIVNSQTIEQVVTTQVISPTSKSSLNIEIGYPVPSSNTTAIIVKRNQYMLSWNPATRNANWVAWRLVSGDIGDVERSDFAEDPGVINPVETNDYEGSCFNRGHLVPSADRTSRPWNNSATFYMSNIAPQTAFLNQRAWKHLEQYERQLAEVGKTLYIFAGPVYSKEQGAVGPKRDIKIPSHFFKIIVVFDKDNNARDFKAANDVISVIMPNTTSANTWPSDDRTTLCKDARKLVTGKEDRDDWRSYSVSISEIENQAALIFF